MILTPEEFAAIKGKRFGPNPGSISLHEIRRMIESEEAHRERIAALEAENADLLKRLDDAQNGEGALIRENERLATALRSIEREGHTWSKYWIVREASAALAGRGK